MKQAMLVAVAVLLPAVVAAQVPRADSAFVAGDFVKARAFYEQALAADSLNERALWRLALLDSSDNQLDRSLQRFARARQVDPANADLMVAQARVMSWAGRTASAVALYDTALAQDTGRIDALAGRAQSVAWAGELDRAEGLWRSALAAHPDDPTLLVGLAQTLYWKGEPGLARSYVDRARAVAPGDASARDLERVLRAALRPDFGTSFTGAGDSDHETFYSQDLWISGPVLKDVRGTLAAGWHRAASDGSAANSSYGLSGLVVTTIAPRLGARAGLGVRHLESAVGNHTPLTAQLGMSWQPASYAALGLGYARASFDETKTLIDSGFTYQTLDFSVDLDPKATVSISGGAGAAWFSDRNRRLSGVLGVLGGLGHGLSVGGFARTMGYRLDTLHDGYFSPARFTVLEARAIYNLRRGHWGLRADGGLGGQQIRATSSSGAPWQSEWHFTAILTRSWNGGEITLEGFLTNSAGSNTVGAFHYHAVTLGFHQGL